MEVFKVIEVKKSIYENNDRQAEALREKLHNQNIFLLNLMSSPGSGKTSTLLRTIEMLGAEYQLGILEADIDSDVDAKTIAESGAKVIQVHTGGMCHLTADMTRQGLEELGIDGLDLVVIENIGNLICTAEFDTGANKNVMILSIPEGDDKPLKYPHMFSMVDLVLINKIDAIGFFNFDIEAFSLRVRKLNPSITIIPISAKTGEGMIDWINWLRNELMVFNQK
jgi:hydrogenase nickel incorporation protein HypB